MADFKKTINTYIEAKGDIEIHIFADAHLGDSMSNLERLKERIKYVAETPNAYCVLGGDLMDTAIASSVGDTYAATLAPMEQLRVCNELFSSIAHKVIGVCPGNHERRLYKFDGIDSTALLCMQLGIQDKYSPTAAVLIVRFGLDVKHQRPMTYTVYLNHGSGAGATIGGKLGKLEKYSGIVDCDVYIMNHVHAPAAFKQDFFRVDTRNDCLTQVTHLFVSSAANLEYGGYGAVAGFKPACCKCPVIILRDGVKSADAVL